MTRTETIANKIKNGNYDIESIGKNGREWALEHYSPINTAKHFMEIIN